jgi:hypothetical protein
MAQVCLSLAPHVAPELKLKAIAVLDKEREAAKGRSKILATLGCNVTVILPEGD